MLALVPPMFDAVSSELESVGIDRGMILERLIRDTNRRLDRSIERGRKQAEKEAVVGASVGRRSRRVPGRCGEPRSF